MIAWPPRPVLTPAIAALAITAGGAAAQDFLPSPEVVPATDGGFSEAQLPVTLPGFLTEGGLLDAATPDVVATIGAGVEVSPAYYGASQTEFGPYVTGRFDYVRFPGGFEIGSSRTVGFQRGLGVQGSARYIGPRDSDEYDEIRGLDNLDWSFEAGLGLGYEQRNYRVFGDVRYGFIGHNAWVGDLGADAIAYPVDGLTLTFGPRLDFGSSLFTDTYFGISAEESADSGLPAFDAAGGFYEAGVELGARYLFNQRWGVEGTARWGRLLNSAEESPITQEGSADQYEVRLGITRRISLDF